ncbi:hypothetical protein OL229_15140 [Neisseriaceae bacterium JH1-16]|nr:hypothetical protein [Neisseriaceae bacterium JH1-16]
MLIAIAALFCTSCLVRIVPTFVSLQLSDRTQRYLERILPTAVFINFAVYIAYSEASKEPVAALASLLLVGVIAVLNVSGLITTSLIATGIYFLLVQLLHR